MSYTLYPHTSEDMHEIPDNTIQLIVTAIDERVWASVVESRAANIVPFKIILECYRVLKQDGVFVLNIGKPVLNNPLYKALKQQSRLQEPHLLFPYSLAQDIELSTCFDLRFDFTTIKEIKPNTETFIPIKNGVVPKLDFTDAPIHLLCNIEYWFVFSKGTKIKLNESFLPKTLPKGTSQDIYMLPLAYVVPSMTKYNQPIPSPFNEIVLHMLLRLFTDEGDTVLDPCAGTGTLGKVALKLKRKPIMYETDPTLIPLIHQNMKVI